MTDAQTDLTCHRKKIGVMGGTFDPIHYGHLFAAEKAKEALALDRVIFIPAGNPPHKHYEDMASAEDRYAMTLLAVNNNMAFEVSRMETDRKGRSYTADTLEALGKIHTNSDFFLIVGMDSALDIPNWYNPHKILSLCTVVAITRPGFLRDKILVLAPEMRSSLIVLDTDMVDISATSIRCRVRDGLSVGHLTPKAVCEYMLKKNLYSNMGES
jgi:nicotinate-nucleotide adenylyltransferase